MKTITTALLLLFLVSPAVAQRRHAVHPPAVSDATAAGWLTNHAYWLNDMGPLRSGVSDDDRGWIRRTVRTSSSKSR